MATSYQSAPSRIADYKACLFYHITVISRVSGALQNVDEAQMQTGASQNDIYLRAIRTLDCMVIPYGDTEYITKRTEIFKKKTDTLQEAYELYEQIMLLMNRLEWLLIPEIDVNEFG